MTRTFALVVGIVFLAAGVLGFIPGTPVGHEYLLGIFAVDAVHNLLHLVVGAIAAYLGFAPGSAVDGSRLPTDGERPMPASCVQ